MKKKCLFVLYAFEPFANANTNVAMPIINSLSNYYNIDLVTLNVSNCAPFFEKKNELNIIRYKKQNLFFERLHNLYYLDLTKKRPLPIKVLLSLGKAFSTFLHLFPFFQHPEYRLLKELLSRNDYSLVFSTCESFLSCWHLCLLKKKGLFRSKFIVYFMDPFCFFYKNLGCKKFFSRENEVYENCDLVVVTNEIYSDNKNNDFKKYLHKTFPLNFCNFKSEYEPYSWKEYREGKINCVYAGSLIDEMIRSPKCFLEIIDSMPSIIDFHIICNNLSKDKKDEYQKLLKKNKNIFWHDNIPFDQCKKILYNADFLINLSNKVSNQTPSKIFDYMSTGLPIINFYSLVNDCSNVYLADYPLCLLIDENDSIEKNRDRFLKFVKNNRRKRIDEKSFKFLKDKYSSGKELEKIIERINAKVLS